MHTDLASLRRNYALQSLSETDASPDPFIQFGQWFDEALDSSVLEPNAFSLATATPEGKPSVRTVLLKGFDPLGFTFFTNYESRKGLELLQNPQGAMLFTWLDLQRQIRIEGFIDRISEEESKDYFQSRPKESQIGAWASAQSQPLATRESLETRQQALTLEYADVEKLPLPPFWGGYRLNPVVFEFWQGRESRLHDRLLYTLENGSWKIGRLFP